MHEAPAATPETLDEQIARALAAVDAGTEIARQAIEARGDLVELVLWAARLAETGRDIRQAAMFHAITGQAALTVVPEPARHRARHARRRAWVPRPRGAAAASADGQLPLEFARPDLRLCGFAPAAVLAVLKDPRSWKAAIVAHKIAAAALATGAVAVTAATAAVVIPAGVHAITNAATPAGASAGAPGLYDADPMPSSSLPFARVVTKAKTGKPDSVSAGFEPVLSFPSASAPAAAPSTPQPSSPAPWMPSIPPPPPAQYQTVDLSGTATTATVPVTVAGPWTAYTHSADILLDGNPASTADSGTVTDGTPGDITVTLAGTLDGRRLAHIEVDEADGTIVYVTVRLPAVAPAPAVTPSPAST